MVRDLLAVTEPLCSCSSPLAAGGVLRAERGASGGWGGGVVSVSDEERFGAWGAAVGVRQRARVGKGRRRGLLTESSSLCG